MLKTLQLLAGEALRWFPAGLVAHFRPLPGLRGPCPQCLRCCRMGLCLSLRLLVRQWDGTARVADGSHQLPEERDRANQYGCQCLEHFTGAVREPTDQQEHDDEQRRSNRLPDTFGCLARPFLELTRQLGPEDEIRECSRLYARIRRGAVRVAFGRAKSLTDVPPSSA